MFTNDDECGPQRAGLYLDLLFWDAAQEASWRHDRWDEDYALCAEVLMVLALGADGRTTYAKVKALSTEALTDLIQQCQACVWRVHYHRVECRIKGPADGRRLLERLFLGTR